MPSLRPGRRPGTIKTGGRKTGTPNKLTTELRGMASQYTTQAIAVLAEIMAGGQSEVARLKAAAELLDRGHGKAAQTVYTPDAPSMPAAVTFVIAKQD